MLQSTTGLAVDAFVPPLAPLVLLLFLGSGFAIFCCAVAAGIAAAAGRTGLARILSAGSLAVAVVYGVLLLAASLLSRERTLAVGERKYFCEMDCHLAYSVEGVEETGNGTRVVTVRTWFDPRTIASFRGDAPLTPNPRTVYLVDGAGRRYAAEATASGSTPLTRALRPGESYTTRLLFAVSAGGRPLRLFLGDPPGLESLVVNHEDSPFHAKVLFALPPPVPSPSAGRS